MNDFELCNDICSTVNTQDNIESCSTVVNSVSPAISYMNLTDISIIVQTNPNDIVYQISDSGSVLTQVLSDNDLEQIQADIFYNNATSDFENHYEHGIVLEHVQNSATNNNKSSGESSISIDALACPSELEQTSSDTTKSGKLRKRRQFLYKPTERRELKKKRIKFFILLKIKKKINSLQLPIEEKADSQDTK